MAVAPSKIAQPSRTSIRPSTNLPGRAFAAVEAALGRSFNQPISEGTRKSHVGLIKDAVAQTYGVKIKLVEKRSVLSHNRYEVQIQVPHKTKPVIAGEVLLKEPKSGPGVPTPGGGSFRLPAAIAEDLIGLVDAALVPKPSDTLASRVAVRAAKGFPIGVKIGDKTVKNTLVDQTVKAIVSAFRAEGEKISLVRQGAVRGLSSAYQSNEIYRLYIDGKSTKGVVNLWPGSNHLVGKGPKILIDEIAKIVG